MTSETTATRRRYSVAMKAEVVAACDEPGASVVKVGMVHEVNANVMHRWRQLAREGKATVAKTSELVGLPLTMTTETAPTPADVRVELRRGPVAMTVTWPTSAAMLTHKGEPMNQQSNHNEIPPVDWDASLARSLGISDPAAIEQFRKGDSRTMDVLAPAPSHSLPNVTPSKPATD